MVWLNKIFLSRPFLQENLAEIHKKFVLDKMLHLKQNASNFAIVLFQKFSFSEDWKPLCGNIFTKLMLILDRHQVWRSHDPMYVQFLLL